MITKLTIYQSFVVTALGQIMFYLMGVAFYLISDSNIPIFIAIVVSFLFGGYGVTILEKRMVKAQKERGQ